MFLLALFMAWGITSTNCEAGLNSPLVAETVTLPSVIDSAAIRSVGHYILARHLVRPFLDYQADGQLVGNLMKAWRITDNRTTYTFDVSDDATWSNGEPISCKEIAAHLERLKKAASAINFDFATIKSARCLSPKKLTISLHKSNIFFLSQTTEPEFGPVRADGSFEITSGPYSLREAVPGKQYALRRRTRAYRGINSDAPKDLVFRSSETEEQVEQFLAGKAAFLDPRTTLTADQHQRLLSTPGVRAFQPRIGFTYWLSLSPGSNALNDLNKRRAIQAVLLSSDLASGNFLPTWRAAPQLFLEDGPGRPSREELVRWKQNLPKSPDLKGVQLTLLLDTIFPFNSEIVRRLAGAGAVTSVNYYTGQDEYVAMVRGKQYDIVLTNNDFASVDLLENLSVTFNAARPLVFLEKDDNFVSKGLERARSLPDDAARHPIYKGIGLHVLHRGLVVPLMYRTSWYYHWSGIDLSQWSRLFFEVAFWKAKLH